MVMKQFRELYREFLFRLIDRELLASDAQGDANRLLGRFAAILVWLSVPFALMAFAASNPHVPRQEMLARAWGAEHAVIATTMLIVGLFAVLSWDNVFPDRRDVLVLGPLPVHPGTILAAKAASLAAAVGVTVSVFNGLPGLAMPLALTPPDANLLELVFSIDLYRSLLAYWFTMTAAGAFVLLSVLCIQALAALLPRGVAMRVTSLLQVATFCLCMGVYFLEPPLASPRALMAPESQGALAWIPTYWFLGLFQQMNGSTTGPAQTELTTLAARAWAGLAIAGVGGCGAFLFSYFRVLRKIVEQPDIVPRSHRWLWLPHFGTPVRTAIVQFTIRTLLRSRQHRVILAFWSGMGFAILILFLKTPFAQKVAAVAGGDMWRQASVPVIASSFAVLCFWLLGVRTGMAMPVELKAHWTFRVVPLPPAPTVMNALRTALYAVGIAPLWTALAILLLWFWPPMMAAGHLALFGLAAAITVELCLHGFLKIPFTCSYLPGTSNMHITVCLCLVLGMNILYLASEFVRRALSDGGKFAGTTILLAGLWGIAWWRTQRSALTADGLVFEEEQAPAAVSLGLFRDGFLPTQSQPKD